ncbi:MAG: M48 family metallopeptidase, partial [Mucispirillum sp.]|nr:M48 family metallopeptidase [Mucispirillum sp.]
KSSVFFDETFGPFVNNSVISKIKIEKNQILFLGKIYTFKLDLDLNDTYKIDDDNLIIYSNKNLNTKNNILEFYHQQACIIFSERIKNYSDKLNIRIGKITIGIYKSIWGSFGNINNHISLNEKLILAPLTAIDCIINHELAHYYHHNHSASFYKKLEEIYPTYYKDYTWLSSVMPDRYPPKTEYE